MERPSKILWIDVETTGLNPYKHAIVQFGGIVEIDKMVKERFNLTCNPGDREITDRALEVNGLTREEIHGYRDPEIVKNELLEIFGRYVKNINTRDKFIIGGYNVAFDLKFIDAFFKSFNEKYLFSYIRSTAVDPMHMLAYMEYENMMPEIKNMEKRKLSDLAKLFDVDMPKEHDAACDIDVTRKIYKKMRTKITDYHFSKMEKLD